MIDILSINRWRMSNDDFAAASLPSRLAGKRFSLLACGRGSGRKPLVAVAFVAAAQRFSAPEAIFSRVFPCDRETG
jgi:hypothetical protein